VLGAHGDAFAVGLHHQHVAGGQVVGVMGCLLVEVAGPAGQVTREHRQLGPSDDDPGPIRDDLLRASVAAGGEVVRDQGAHPHRVAVGGQRPAGVGRVEVLLAAVAVGQPRRPDLAEDTDQAPVVVPLDTAVPDPGRGHQVADAFLACGVQRERGLQQGSLQRAALLAEDGLPVGVIRVGRAVDRPADHRGELLYRAGQQRGGLGVERGRAAVLAHPRHRHGHRNRHSRASDLRGDMGSTPRMIPDFGRQPANPAQHPLARLWSYQTSRWPPTSTDNTR